MLVLWPAGAEDSGQWSVSVSLTSRTKTMGLGERFLPPWTRQGEANKCTVYLMPCSSGPVVGRGFNKWVLGRRC